MQSAQVAVLTMMLVTSAAQWWMWRRRRIQSGNVMPRRETPSVEWNPVAVGLALLFIALGWRSVMQPAHVEQAAASVGAMLFVCLFNVSLFLILLPLLAVTRIERLRDFGFDLADWRQQVRLGLETGAASLLPVFLMLQATYFLRSEADQHVMLRALQDDPGLEVLGAVLLAAVISAPLLEELLFRVILLGWLKSRFDSRLAIGVSAIAFAGVHGPKDGIALLPLAVMLGWLYDRQMRFVPVFTAHAFFNLWNIVLALSGRP